MGFASLVGVRVILQYFGVDVRAEGYLSRTTRPSKPIFALQSNKGRMSLSKWRRQGSVATDRCRIFPRRRRANHRLAPRAAPVGANGIAVNSLAQLLSYIPPAKSDGVGHDFHIVLLEFIGYGCRFDQLFGARREGVFAESRIRPQGLADAQVESFDNLNAPLLHFVIIERLLYGRGKTMSGELCDVIAFKSFPRRPQLPRRRP